MYSYWTTLTRTHLIHDAWHLGTPSGKYAVNHGFLSKDIQTFKVTGTNNVSKVNFNWGGGGKND